MPKVAGSLQAAQRQIDFACNKGGDRIDLHQPAADTVHPLTVHQVSHPLGVGFCANLLIHNALQQKTADQQEQHRSNNRPPPGCGSAIVRAAKRAGRIKAILFGARLLNAGDAPEKIRQIWVGHIRTPDPEPQRAFW